MKQRLISLTIALVLVLPTLLAQPSKKHSARYYRKHPVWIDMMNDPKANYYETIKAFREYWKDRELPKEEFENGTQDEFEKEVGLVEEEEHERKRAVKKGVSYASEVRAFKGWLQSNKSWVRPDGSIISEDERQQIINQQRTELKEIERKNEKK